MERKTLVILLAICCAQPAKAVCQYFLESTASSCAASTKFPNPTTARSVDDCKKAAEATGKLIMGKNVSPELNEGLYPPACYFLPNSNNDVWYNVYTLSTPGSNPSCSSDPTARICLCMTTDCLPTDVPDTNPPATDAPQTAVPLTAIPTQAPVTTAPSTAQPTAPPTTVPVTAVPTTAPATDAPATAVPAAPPTAPPTDAPQTVPPTAPPTAPPTTAPDTAPPAAPPTVSPQTVPPTAPPTLPPQTVPPTSPPTAPPTMPPDTKAPLVPPTFVPKTTAPTPSPASPTAPPTSPPNVPVTASPGTPKETASPSGPVSPVTDSPWATASPWTTASPWMTASPPTDLPAGQTMPPATAAPPTPVPPHAVLDVVVQVSWHGPAKVDETDVRDGLVYTITLMNPQYVEFQPWGTRAPPFKVLGTEAHITYVSHDATTLVVKVGGDAGYHVKKNEILVLEMTMDAVKAKTGYYVKVQLEGEKTQVTVKVEESGWQTGVKFSAGTATLLGGPAAMQAQTITFLVGLDCGDEDDPPLTWMLHPTLGVIDGRECMGAVVLNPVIALGVFLIQLLFAKILLHLAAARPFIETPHTIIVTQALLLFPSASILVVMVLFQGTAVCSAAMMFYPRGKVSHGVIGGVVLALQIVFTGYITRLLLNNIPEKARYRLEKDGNDNISSGKIKIFFLGAGEWVSTERSTRFAKRYSIVVRGWAEACIYFVAVDFVMCLLFALMAAFRPRSLPGCGNLRFALGALSCAAGILTLIVKPYVKYRDTWITVGRLILQGIGFGLIGVSFHVGEPTTHFTMQIGAVLLMIAVLLVVIKAVIDAACFMFLIWTGRRRKLQIEEWGEIDKIFSDDIEIPLKSPRKKPPMIETGGEASLEEQPISPDRFWEEMVQDVHDSRNEGNLSWAGLVKDAAISPNGKPMYPMSNSNSLNEPLLEDGDTSLLYMSETSEDMSEMPPKRKAQSWYAHPRRGAPRASAMSPRLATHRNSVPAVSSPTDFSNLKLPNMHVNPGRGKRASQSSSGPTPPPINVVPV
eukprot:TRINITY_DN3323_c5_g1_i1.p1 TRINITY_DN3323_c5_g1~~TRINITY_DN3323_c5_g1_i1.p1  ORF type:complete len:1031 (+),score=173.29 TRINITY_DN3323_c5_g1_i1:135-3227(+)